MASSTPQPAGEIRRSWRMVAGAATGVGVGLTGLPNYTFGTFLKPLSAEFGWTRAEISVAILCLHAGTFLTSPFVGGVVDRLGARRLALSSLLGLVIGLLCVASSGPSLISYYAAWGLLALLGCATTPLTWTRMINRQFDRSLGLALGLALMGTGIASLAGPPLCSILIEHYGWRGAYAALAALVLFVALPVAALGTRPRAEQAIAPTVSSEGLSLRQAVRTRRFWMIAAGIFLVIVGQGGATVHLVPLLSDRGISPAIAASLVGLLGVGVIVGRVVVGLSLDRWPAPLVAACFLPLPALACVILALTASIPMAVIAILLFGLAAGAEVDLLSFLTSRYFGRRHYGRIYGVNLSIFALAAGLGPTITGWSFDRSGSYQIALWCGVVIFLLGSLILGRLGAYPVFAKHAEPVT